MNSIRLYLKNLIKEIFKLLGFRISKLNNYSNIESLEVISSILSKNSEIIIFDVGAHIGQSTKSYRKFFKKAYIYSFEPSPESFKSLSALNIKNFKPYNFGFSDKKTKEEFFINSNNTATNSLLSFAENATNVWGVNNLKTVEKIVCEFSTIDEFIKQNKIKQIDFLKIDVQGAEYLVLEGAKKTLLNKKIKVIQLEVFFGDTYVGQKSIGFYIKLLENYGYEFKIFSDNVMRKGVLVQSDLIFTA